MVDGFPGSGIDVPVYASIRASSVDLDMPIALQKYIVVNLEESEASAGMSVDLVAGTLTIGTSGIYLVNFESCFSSNKNGEVIGWVFLNGVATKVVWVRTISNPDVGSASGSNFVSLTGGDVLDMRMRSDIVGTTITNRVITLSVFLIG